MSEKYHRERSRTQSFIYSINEIKPMRLFYNFVENHYSKHVTLNKNYSDTLIRNLNDMLFISTSGAAWDMINQYIGMRLLSPSNNIRYTDDWNAMLMRFLDGIRVNFSLPVIMTNDMQTEQMVERVVYWLGHIMNTLVSKFYTIFGMAILEHCELRKNASVRFSKILPSNHRMTDMSYEPFYIIPLQTLVPHKNRTVTSHLNIVVYPMSKMVCIYEYDMADTVDKLKNKTSSHPHIKIFDDCIVNSSMYKKTYGLQARILQYNNLKDMVMKIRQLIHECYGGYPNAVTSVKRNMESEVDVRIGNLMNYLYCDINDDVANKQMFNMYFDSIGEKGILLTRPTQITTVANSIYATDEVKSAVDQFEKESAPLVTSCHSYITGLNSKRRESLQQFIKDNVDEVVKSIVIRSIRNNDSYIPEELPIKINTFIRNFTAKTAKVGVYFTINDDDTTDTNEYSFCSFYLYNYENNSNDTRQLRPFIVNKMIQSFLPGSRSDLTLALSIFVNNLTDQDNELFCSHLRKRNIIVNPKIPIATRNAWRSAFMKLYDIIIGDDYYKDQLANLCDLYHTYDQKFTNDPDVIAMKKLMKDHSKKINHIMEEKLTSRIEDSINNLTLKSTGCDISKFVAQVNYYCNTSLECMHMIGDVNIGNASKQQQPQ